MRRVLALLLALVLLAAAPGAALAATTTAKSGGASGSGGVSPQTASSTAGPSTAPVVPTPNGSTNPLSGGVAPVSPAPTPTATTPTQVITNQTAQTAGSSSLSSASVAVIVLGAVAVLGGIAYFIWRDARRRAPLQHGDAGLGVIGHRGGSKAPPKPRKLSPAERKRRKRGKAR